MTGLQYFFVLLITKCGLYELYHNDRAYGQEKKDEEMYTLGVIIII